jgi:formate dehydrogenase major subunit
VRRGERLEPASWAEALSQAASGLRGLVEAGLAVGVLGSARATNEESYLAARLARAGLGTPHLDSALRASYQPLADGILDVGGPGALRGTLDDLEQSEAILVVEGDLAKSHPRVAFSVMRAVKSGARLVTLGWARTPLARLSTLHLPMAPGGEAEALLGLAAAATTRVGVGAAIEGLEGQETLRERLARCPPTESQRLVAEWFGVARRAGVLIAPLGAPPAEARGFAQAMALFAALTGHLRRPGSVMLPLPALGNLRGACEMGVRPDRFPLGRALDDTSARVFLRSVWEREPCAEPGLDAAAMLEQVGGLVAVGDEVSPALGRAGLDALARLRRLVVLDAFVTPTTRLAHVVLPIAAHAEAEGSVTNLEGRVQELRAGMPPPGSARPGWGVLSDLGVCLGLPAPYRSLADVRREIAEVRRGLAAGAGLRGQLQFPTLEELPADAGAVLVRDGVYDWGSDPLVLGSPTLRREPASLSKRFPQGLVEISPPDAERLSLRAGSSLRLTSAVGEAVVPFVLRPGLEPGLVLVPFAFRDQLESLLGKRRRTEVRLGRA